MAQASTTRRRRSGGPTVSGGARILGLGLCLLLPACQSLDGKPNRARFPNRLAGTSDAEVYRSAQLERVAYLERQVTRLREDLRQAEDSLVAIESGLRGMHTRADAVSSLAEARIEVERARRMVTWRPERVAEAQAKLEEAERQLQAGHSGSAVFFATRARRIAGTLNEEGRQVARHASTRFVKAPQVNLRSGPSTEYRVVDVLSESTPVFPEREQGEWVLVRTVAGYAGWVHTQLLRPR